MDAPLSLNPASPSPRWPSPRWLAAGRPRRNWAGNHRWRPRHVALPATEGEVAEALAFAAARGLPVRAVGAAHSWSDVAATDGLALSLERMRRVVRVDRERLEVTVEGGVRLREWIAALAREGLTPLNLGSITEQTVAGAIATGTHGTGIGLGNLSTQVTRLRLVTAEGRVIEVSEREHADLLPAARLHLGSLGIVTEVTLRAAPAHRLVEVARPVPFDDLLGSLDDWVAAHERVKAWWMPHAGIAFTTWFDRTEAPADEGLGVRLGDRLDRSEALHLLFRGIVGVGARWPSAAAPLSRLVAWAYFRDKRRVGPAEERLPIAMPPRHLECEYAIPAASAVEALRRLDALIRTEDLRIGLPVEVRFVAGDDLYLSPCYQQPSCMLIATIGAGARDTYPYFAGFERIMRSLGGRPHWGKSFAIGAEALAAAFPRLRDFDAVRRRLDPRGRLLNAFTERVFGG